MADKLQFIRDEMKRLADESLMINLRTMDSAVGGWMVVDGKKCLNFCTNNYLGLANHPKIKEASKAAIDKWGVGPAAVRSIAGTQALHIELEKKLASFKGVEDALFLQSGFCANQAAIAPMVGKGDVVFSDRLNHASIIDGCRLSGAKIKVFEHADPESADKVITENLKDFGKGIIISDGVFSMDGDVAPLDKLYEVAQKHNLPIMVDDAHGEGVMGRGKGIVHHFGLSGKFDLEVGTMSKAFGAVGGVIAGKKEIIDYIRQKARPFLFSSAATPADTAACLASVELVESSPELVDKLWANGEYLGKGLRELGFDTGASQTPILPVMLGETEVAMPFSKKLFENGLFAMGLGFPTVPKGQARVRVMSTAAHTKDDLDQALDIFKAVGKEMSVI
jgi:glycine C-acetyltransferase